MPTIEIRPGTKIDIEDILAGVSNLNSEELEKFVEKVLVLRAKRVSPNLSKAEASLIKKINRNLPPAVRKRFSVLEAKRSEGSLSEVEHRELLAIVEELEQLNAERVQCLGELAQLRGIAVRDLMKQLGIRPQPNA
ncbi:MAG: hypothetical protein IPH04_14205 [Saprospirales bacterium]|nr:hypothetical protein [Saprospirales bacterium]